MHKIEDILGLIGELVMVSVICLALGLAIGGLLTMPMNTANAEPVTVTTINRAEFMEDSGDSELPLVKFANAIDRLTGWSNLSMDEQAVRVKCAGLIIETVGKTLPKNCVDGGFFHAFFRQCGVQMQVAAMHHLDEISHDPAIAFVQGVLIGL